MHHPTTWLESFNKALEVEVDLNAQFNCTNFVTWAHPTTAMGPTQTFKVQKMSPTEMSERGKQGLCHCFDEKYSVVHKCEEPKFS